MRTTAFTLALLGALAQPLHAQQEFPARLAGHAVLPAATFLSPPADAPSDLRISGKFANGPTRIEAIGTSEGRSAGRPTGLKLPFMGQPVQGHSGIKHMPAQSTA